VKIAGDTGHPGAGEPGVLAAWQLNVDHPGNGVLIVDANHLVGKVEKMVGVGEAAIASIDKLTGNVDKTVAVGKDALVDARQVLSRAGPALEKALLEVDKLAKDAQKLAVSADGVVNADSPLRYDLANALKEIQGAARSLRVLADYLDRHPEAVLSGKSAQVTQ